MQTTKEKVIKKSIAICENRIKAIDEILDFNACSELIQIRIDFQEIRSRNLPYSQEFPLIKKLSERDKKANLMLAKQKQSCELISEKAKLTVELNALGSELFFLEKRHLG